LVRDVVFGVGLVGSDFKVRTCFVRGSCRTSEIVAGAEPSFEIAYRCGLKLLSTTRAFLSWSSISQNQISEPCGVVFSPKSNRKNLRFFNASDSTAERVAAILQIARAPKHPLHLHNIVGFRRTLCIPSARRTRWLRHFLCGPQGASAGFLL